jgi:small nuclear ribonucleoprotein (snRNP)-like protein
MGASIEKSLYIGELKTRFDLFDDVKLKLKTGEIVEGTIEGFEDCSVVQMETERGWREIHVDDIEGGTII